MHFITLVQVLMLGLYLILLSWAAFPLTHGLEVDFFQRLDPLVFADQLLSTRSFAPVLVPGLLIILLSLILGRFFCGYICPMGITLDFAQKLSSRNSGSTRALSVKKQSGLIKIKYLFLFFLAGAALSGISLVFLGSPLSLITRFYALLIYPGLIFIMNGLLGLFFPLLQGMGLDSLAYLELQSYRFAAQWFTALFFAGLFFLVIAIPAFWCRFICPAGALLALVSRKPLIRRKVGPECTNCGLCIKKCPMQAIADNPFHTQHQECVVCQSCVRVCPENAVSFTFSGPGSTRTPVPDRRQFLASTLAGAGSAVLIHTSISTLKNDSVPGNIQPADLIRPPGALPEEDFQDRCIRCGLCMKACPTNTLQPVWFESGLGGLFSPRVLPRRGPCDPQCNVCGQVCPTGAIRNLCLEEKTWARMGTSHVLPHKCLAWQWKKQCLVCFEVCPYAAVELKREEGIPVPVPEIIRHKCSGCGACEYHCPVQGDSAVVVRPAEAMRIRKGSYIARGGARGYELKADPERSRKVPDYLINNDESDVLPPGFSF